MWQYVRIPTDTEDISGEYSNLEKPGVSYDTASLNVSVVEAVAIMSTRSWDDPLLVQAFISNVPQAECESYCVADQDCVQSAQLRLWHTVASERCSLALELTDTKLCWSFDCFHHVGTNGFNGAPSACALCNIVRFGANPLSCPARNSGCRIIISVKLRSSGSSYQRGGNY